MRLRAALGALALLLTWALVARLGPWPSYVLPAPADVAHRLWETLRDGRLHVAVLVSLRRLALGYGLAAAIGIVLGMATARSQPLREATSPLLLGLQSLPSVCWLPLALLWFGLSENAILFVVVMGSVLSVSVATEGAVRSIPPLHLRAARTLGARRLSLYTHVILPAALPGILTGLRLGWTFAWRSLMAGELLFVAGGLGQLMTLGRELNDMALVIAVMAVIVALGLGFERLLFGSLERRVRERRGT